MRSLGEGRRGPAVAVRNVSHGFDRDGTAGVPVLAELTLDIASGETVALVGPSGSGKSTLLGAIAGQLRPRTGTVAFGDTDRTPRISQVFQDPGLLPWRTVAENVRLPLELTRDLDHADERVARALELASVSEFASFLPRELSGGLATRVAIARALVTEPDLILFDEPFGSLDEVTAEEVMLQIVGVLDELGATAVLVTHSVEQAVYLANRVIVLSPRPARLVATVVVDRPGPRTPAFLGEEDFVRCVLEVRRLLRAGVA